MGSGLTAEPSDGCARDSFFVVERAGVGLKSLRHGHTRAVDFGDPHTGDPQKTPRERSDRGVRKRRGRGAEAIADAERHPTTALPKPRPPWRGATIGSGDARDPRGRRGGKRGGGRDGRPTAGTDRQPKGLKIGSRQTYEKQGEAECASHRTRSGVGGSGYPRPTSADYPRGLFWVRILKALADK